MVLFCSLKNVENYLMKLLLTCYSKPFLKMLVFGTQKMSSILCTLKCECLMSTLKPT